MTASDAKRAEVNHTLLIAPSFQPVVLLMIIMQG